GTATPTADPAAPPRRLHRPRPPARAPEPARAAGRCRRHLAADADLPLRHPRRAAPRGPRPRPGPAGGGVHRAPAGPAGRGLHGDPGPRVVGDDRAAGPALPADVHQAARQRRGAAVARLPARRDHRLARPARGRHAHPRPPGAGHRRARRHPRAARGPGRHRRRRPHLAGLPRLPRHRPRL
ncbi:MAG: regulatory protein, TetR, partial [uncultured Quadrisphaera sp.]